MPKVTITALPRQGFRGFGAIEEYFLIDTPREIDVTDAQYKELHEDPARFFLKVEYGFNSEKAPAEPPAEPPAPPKPPKK